MRIWTHTTNNLRPLSFLMNYHDRSGHHTVNCLWRFIFRGGQGHVGSRLRLPPRLPLEVSRPIYVIMCTNWPGRRKTAVLVTFSLVIISGSLNHGAHIYIYICVCVCYNTAVISSHIVPTDKNI